MKYHNMKSWMTFATKRTVVFDYISSLFIFFSLLIDSFYRYSMWNKTKQTNEKDMNLNCEKYSSRFSYRVNVTSGLG